MTPHNHQKDEPLLSSTVFAREEAWLWGAALVFLLLVGFGLLTIAWEHFHSIPFYSEWLTAGLFLVASFFTVFAYLRRRQISKLQQSVRTLQKRAEAEAYDDHTDELSRLIARSQRSFKELIDSFDDVAFAASLDGTLRTVNRRLSEFLELPYVDLVGHKLEEFLEEPKRHEIEAGLSRFMEKRRWAGLQRIRIKHSNRVLYFDCVLNAILKDDEVVGVSALARDLTQEREKEQRFTELFETLQEGVYFSTPEGKLLDVNAALVQVLGYEAKEEMLSLTSNALNSNPEDPPILGRTADDRGGVRTREIRLRRKDNAMLTFVDSSRAVWDQSGKIIRYQGTLVDVSEQRQMERTLRQQEEFRRHLLESFPDLIVVFDLNERHSFVSSRIRDLLGYAPEDLLGKQVEEEQIYTGEFRALLRDVLSGRKMFGVCEHGARHRDGSWRTMRTTASPLFDAENKLSGVIVSVRDMTVERKLEQQIIQSERLAAMGQMIGGFAHELNNPLTSILGLSELLQEGDKSESEKKQLVMLQQQARRAADIVQNLTYFSRPPAAGRSAIDVSELVQRTLHLHAYSLRKNNISVDFVPEASFPSISGDPHQLMQVFLNLLLNAEQSMREAKERGTVRIRLRQSQNSISVVFQDDGPGIAPEILPNIFDPFYTTKRPGRGTGLGLSICKAILREHSGNIEAASGPEGGAVFTVTLPVPPTD